MDLHRPRPGDHGLPDPPLDHPGPPGETGHRVYAAAGPLKPYRLLCEFRGATVDKQVLVHTPGTPLQDVRLIKVVTEKSPSWVGWREIMVISP